ncbi:MULTISPECIES: GAF domain-containing protein [Nocardia]|uniref:GAF domain-containing protein n=1 Tax=Nocardia TaxID=1817 RepID=UPI000D685BBC|nr:MULTISPECIES: GAF domain-containing protein [Nocardia]
MTVTTESELARPKTRDDDRPVVPWVLLETSGGPDTYRVIAEGPHPRRRTRIERTRIAGSSVVARRLPAVIAAAIATGHQKSVTAPRASGYPMRITAVPVTVGTEVLAVQVWAGASTTPVPPKPAVGTVLWPVDSHGVGLTSSVFERMIDSDRAADGWRTLPDLTRHFDHIEDRNGLLGLFDDTAEPRQWSGTVVTTGLVTRARRTLFVAAHSVGVGAARVVRAVATDVSVAHPPSPPRVSIRLLRRLPVRGGHGIGVLDLKSGLVHEWVHAGPAPLHRLVTEMAVVHPDDRAQLCAARTDLLTGTDHARTTIRIRFGVGVGGQWITVNATWVVLTRDGAPQAMVDLQLAEVSRRPRAAKAFEQ